MLTPLMETLAVVSILYFALQALVAHDFIGCWPMSASATWA